MINVTQKHDCYGCAACAMKCPVDCIRMVEDNEGFLYPQVDRNLCTDCGLCDSVCPLNMKYSLSDSPDVYACKNKNVKIRLESTSGGAFTSLAEHVLDEKGVVYGAMFDKDFHVIHGCVERKEDVYKLRGSKYSQSVMGTTYKEAEEYLQKGVQVLFSGTPCQIGGLRSYLGKEYDNLIAVDLVCHGVPSPRVYREHVASLKAKYREEIKNIYFRDKNRGWKLFSFSVYFKKNIYSQGKFDDLFMRGFLACYYLRPSCHKCIFKGRNRGSDITIGDYWGVHTRFPAYDDDLGVGLVIVNNERGNEVWGKITNTLDVLKSDIEHAAKYNHSYANSVPSHPKREQFFSDLNAMEFEKVMEKYCADEALRPVESGH